MTPSPKTHVRMTQGRVKSNTPPIVPGHTNNNYSGHYYGRKSAAVDVKEKQPKEMDYFAGAKFDCLPSVSSLPTPPVEWTIPVLRSQSQPSSPVTTTTGGSGVRIDLSSLFSTPQPMNKVSQSEFEPTVGHHQYYREQNKKNVDEIDTHNCKTVEKKVTSSTKNGTRRKDESKGHHYHAKQNNSKYSKPDKSSAASAPLIKSSPKIQESKPINIATTFAVAGAYEQKQMYPHLTESLKCLLKVQG